MTLRLVSLTLRLASVTLRLVSLTLRPVSLTLRLASVALRPVSLTLKLVRVALRPVRLTLRPARVALRPVRLALRPTVVTFSFRSLNVASPSWERRRPACCPAGFCQERRAGRPRSQRYFAAASIESMNRCHAASSAAPPFPTG